MLEYRHDDKCSTIRTQRLDDCTCTPEVALLKYAGGDR
jgi:hypothetical protein